MKNSSMRPRLLRRLVLAAALVAGVGSASCGGSVLGLDSDGTDEVRIALSVSDGAPEITYLVSTNFDVRPIEAEQPGDPTLELRLRAADTVTTSLPLDERFATGTNRRLFFQVLERTEVVDPMSLQVWLDDNPLLQNAFEPDEEPVLVLYVFGGGVLIPEAITVL